MTGASYQPLPTSAVSASPAGYPPNQLDAPVRPVSWGLPFDLGNGRFQMSRTKSKSKAYTWLVIRGLVVFSVGLVVLHFLILGLAPDSSYSGRFASSKAGDDAFEAAAGLADDVLGRLDPSASRPGSFFRDSYPLRSMAAFWDLAEKEVAARGLDTCNGQLSRELVTAYHEAELAYCLPAGISADSAQPTNFNNSRPGHWDGTTPVPATTITCSPVHRSLFSQWWPYPAAPCLATNLRTVPGDDRKFAAKDCQLTVEGEKLRGEMGTERFLGSDIVEAASDAPCEELIERTLLVIGRQDQWNPFHVAEDLITTLVSSFIAIATAPALIDTRVQLVFVEGYGMDTNHFTPLWDRMGAWAPRRLSLDPWTKGTCLTNTIHSVGAGASLLSAMGVGNPYSCASTITWAASHYYRHLFGLLPRSLYAPETLLESHHSIGRPRKPINVLWLSRAKLDQYAKGHNDWSVWRDVRHITNEKELLQRLRLGLSNMCQDAASAKDFGPAGCVFEDAQEIPETWSHISPDTLASDKDPLPIRFATIDPTVHALETQIHYVGHTTVLVSSHGGALGLSLFLPPGDGTLIELQVEQVIGNHHFQHMAKEMGHNYELIEIAKTVDVDRVWESLQRWVWKMAQPG
ncbi:hypothetical protein IAU60_001103 [Kwoniella sp. DSM 27419]